MWIVANRAEGNFAAMLGAAPKIRSTAPSPKAAAFHVNAKDAAWVDSKTTPHPTHCFTEKLRVSGGYQRTRRHARPAGRARRHSRARRVGQAVFWRPPCANRTVVSRVVLGFCSNETATCPLRARPDVAVAVNGGHGADCVFNPSGRICGEPVGFSVPDTGSAHSDSHRAESPTIRPNAR